MGRFFPFPHPVKIASLHIPQVVATVTRRADLDFLSSGEGAGCDILEYRLDNLLDDLDAVRSTISHVPVPALITARRPSEGGVNDLSDEFRIGLCRDFLEPCCLMDLEIASFQSGTAFGDLAAEARERGVIVVGSFHDFMRFPVMDTLRSTIETGYDFGIDVVKLAVFIETMSELFQLVRLVEEQREKGRLISAMGMGPMGKLSRLVLARAGSCLNYGYLQTENAPGQWPARELQRLIHKIGGSVSSDGKSA